MINFLVLGPINSKAQLKLNSKPESDGSGFKIPKVWLNVVMEEIAVGLSRLQVIKIDFQLQNVHFSNKFETIKLTFFFISYLE